MLLTDLEQKNQISDTVLGCIEHGTINNVKIKDLIQINNILDESGMFFALHWMASLQIVNIKEIITKEFSRREAQKLFPIENAAYNLVKLGRLLRNQETLLRDFIRDLRSL